jgi:S-adenosylmethionine-diacylgycerolhomoserine-N-methlytransferase
MSYSLSMIPEWETALEQAKADLNESGRIGIVDFCMEKEAAAARWFSYWMTVNNVTLDRPYLSFLNSQFNPDRQVVQKAFCGLWSFYRFVGTRS